MVSFNFSLPIDLIFDILSRLPVKTLIQLKSVCKTWYVLIENPNFIKVYHTQLSKRINSTPDLTSVLILECDHKMASYSMLLQCKDRIFNPNLIANQNLVFQSYPYIVGICDGLVCAVLNDSEAVICNPTTGKIRKMSQFCLQEVKSDVVFFGFGFHDNEYKLFRFVYSALESDFIVHGEVYSMSGDVWMVIKMTRGVIDIDQRITSCVSSNPTPVAVNEVLYWRAYSSSSVPSVVSFDMNGNVIGVIACPHDLIEACKVHWQLVNLKGELALVTTRGASWFELWVLDVKDRSWTRKIRTVNLPQISRGLKCLGCDRSGNLVLQYYSAQMEIKLYLYDIEFQDAVYLAFPGPNEKHYDVYLYTESLLAV